ncbi:NTP transferase domain-containing protein [Patescibacteria group bacterium]|nr:NTP transferase domain-containing protein [Patescibacteria group bacterium]
MRIGAVIPAAGYGTITSGRSKLIEDVAGKPLVCHLLEAVAMAGVDPIAVVTNHRYGGQIRETLGAYLLPGGSTLRFAEQAERRGAADAVRAAVPLLREAGCNSMLVAFGDMPCWTAASLKDIIAAHTNGGKQVTMTLIPTALVSGRAEFVAFGRALVDQAGKVISTFEPRDRMPSKEEMACAAYLNAALYVIDLDVFEGYFPRTSAFDRGDGYPPEIHLPAMIEVMSRSGVDIGTFILSDVEETRGVNTHSELEIVRAMMEAHRGALP